jgi:hypothetical protein
VPALSCYDIALYLDVTFRPFGLCNNFSINGSHLGHVISLCKKKKVYQDILVVVDQKTQIAYKGWVPPATVSSPLGGASSGPACWWVQVDRSHPTSAFLDYISSLFLSDHSQQSSPVTLEGHLPLTSLWLEIVSALRLLRHHALLLMSTGGFTALVLQFFRLMKALKATLFRSWKKSSSWKHTFTSSDLFSAISVKRTRF